jgi:glutamate-1-semialdehyde 2,1-aminomutase
MAESIVDTYVRLHPGSSDLYRDSLAVFPSGVTHDIRYVRPFPLYVDRAAGPRKWDVDGNEIIDFVMGHGALFLGHAHPEVTAAITAQAAKGTHYGANHRLELEWGRLVQQLVPSAEEVRFTSSGTEATLMAIRLARAYTGRDRVLKFDHHFHGWHDYVVGARPPEEEHPHSAGVPAATSSNTISLPQGDLAGVEEKLAGGDVAAVILEPTGASWGTLPLGSDFLAGLRQACDRRNTVLIFDEVVTGFRVAPGGAQEACGVKPDLTSLAKILAGGMPGGAVCGRRDILSTIEFRDGPWNANGRIQHPGTFNANPVSAAAGAAMLQIVATAGPHAHAGRLNQALVTGLNAELDRAGAPGCAYGLASYFHITLGSECPRPVTAIEWTAVHPPPRMRADLQAALKRGMLNHGVDLMGGAGGFVSGAHTDEEIAATIRAFRAAIADIQSERLL